MHTATRHCPRTMCSSRRQARVRGTMRQGYSEKDFHHAERRASKVLHLLASPSTSQGSQWLAVVYQTTKTSALISLFSTRTGRSQDLLTLCLSPEQRAAKVSSLVSRAPYMLPWHLAKQLPSPCMSVVASCHFHCAVSACLPGHC